MNATAALAPPGRGSIAFLDTRTLFVLFSLSGFVGAGLDFNAGEVGKTARD